MKYVCVDGVKVDFYENLEKVIKIVEDWVNTKNKIVPVLAMRGVWNYLINEAKETM